MVFNFIFRLWLSLFNFRWSNSVSERYLCNRSNFGQNYRKRLISWKWFLILTHCNLLLNLLLLLMRWLLFESTEFIFGIEGELDFFSFYRRFGFALVTDSEVEWLSNLLQCLFLFSLNLNWFYFYFFLLFHKFADTTLSLFLICNYLFEGCNIRFTIGWSKDVWIDSLVVKCFEITLI